MSRALALVPRGCLSRPWVRGLRMAWPCWGEGGGSRALAWVPRAGLSVKALGAGAVYGLALLGRGWGEPSPCLGAARGIGMALASGARVGGAERLQGLGVEQHKVLGLHEPDASMPRGRVARGHFASPHPPQDARAHVCEGHPTEVSRGAPCALRAAYRASVVPQPRLARGNVRTARCRACGRMLWRPGVFRECRLAAGHRAHCTPLAARARAVTPAHTCASASCLAPMCQRELSSCGRGVNLCPAPRITRGASLLPRLAPER